MSKCAAAGSSRPKVHDVSKSSARALTAKCLADSSLHCEASFIRLTLTERGFRIDGGENCDASLRRAQLFMMFSP